MQNSNVQQLIDSQLEMGLSVSVGLRDIQGYYPVVLLSKRGNIYEAFNSRLLGDSDIVWLTWDELKEHNIETGWIIDSTPTCDKIEM